MSLTSPRRWGFRGGCVDRPTQSINSLTQIRLLEEEDKQQLYWLVKDSTLIWGPAILECWLPSWQSCQIFVLPWSNHAHSNGYINITGWSRTRLGSFIGSFRCSEIVYCVRQRRPIWLNAPNSWTGTWQAAGTTFNIARGGATCSIYYLSLLSTYYSLSRHPKASQIRIIWKEWTKNR